MSSVLWSISKTVVSSRRASFGIFIEESPSSAERTAFISACSKEVPIAMTSPVAIIWVPRVRFA